MGKKQTTNPGFKLSLNDAKIFKSIVDTLSNIVDETRIVLTPDKLVIKAMDPSRICLLKLEMSNDDWDLYDCDIEQDFCVNMEDLKKITDRAAQKDKIELSSDFKNQKIIISMNGENTNRRRSFRLGMLESEIEDVPVENLLKIDYDSSFSIDLKILEEALKDAEIYSEVISIKSTEELLHFSSVGQIGEMDYELDAEELEDYKSQNETEGSYSTNFLKKILKMRPITEKFMIHFKTDHPIRLEFSIIEGGKIDYFLAPRVEEVDFEDEYIEEPAEEQA